MIQQRENTSDKSDKFIKDNVIHVKIKEETYMAFPEMIKMDYMNIGKVRFIGASVLFTGDDAWDSEIWIGLWKAVDAYHDELTAMLEKYGIEGLKYPCSLVYSGDQGLDGEVYYIAGYFFREGTPVPEGLQYHDIESTEIGFAHFHNQHDHKDLEDTYTATRDRILSDGHKIPYPVGYWNAEVHTSGRTIGEEVNFGYLFPVV